MKSFLPFAIMFTLLLALAAAASGQKPQKRAEAAPRTLAAVVLPLPAPPAPAVVLPSAEEMSPVCGPHKLKCAKCAHCVGGECVKKTPSAAPSTDPEAVCR